MERKLRSVELRKVVERMCLHTGAITTFVQIPGFGPAKAVNASTVHVDEPHVFTEEFVDDILNHYGTVNGTYVYTLTEKEYRSYE